MKMHGEVDVQIHVFLTSVLVGVEWSTSHTWYPLARRLGGLQSWSGRYREVIILDTTGTRTLIPQSSNPQLVAIPTVLAWL
jgi:hypothetical protein